VSSDGVPDREFGYELLVCRWAERAWRPDGDRVPALVARQLGTADRRWDTVVVEVDPDGFRRRRALDDAGLDSDLLSVVRHAPADWAWYRDALPEPDYPWRYVRAAVNRAGERGVVETRSRSGRVQLRRVAPYPDWVRRLIAVENKPDLDASAARRLGEQLRHDVDRGLADEVWVATGTTGDRVAPALLEDLPVEAGVLVTDFRDGVRPDAAEVAWYPARLRGPDAGRAGSAGEDGDGGGGDGSGGDGGHPPDRTRRLELAERAYDRGWRSYRGTMRPDCREFRLRRHGDALVPDCAAKGRCQTAAECSGSCASFAPEPPAWRTRGPPIEGGPGRALVRLLDRRRDRVRDRLAGGGADGG